MAERVMALYFEDTGVKLLVAKGRKAEQWAIAHNKSCSIGDYLKYHATCEDMFSAFIDQMDLDSLISMAKSVYPDANGNSNFPSTWFTIIKR